MLKVILPPVAALEAAVAELTRAAVAAGDTKRQIALNKAVYDLLIGQPAIVRVSGGYLLPSTSRAGLVHRLDDVTGCSCEAGRAGRCCRHVLALELIEQANARTMPSLISVERAAKLAAAAEAAALLNECF